jgi:DNA-binding response OmpR family regulator
MSSGAWDYLTKPFTRSQLLNSIQTQLDRYREAQKLLSIEVKAGERRARQELLLELPDQLSNPLNQIFLSFQLLSDEEDTTERQQLITDGLAAATQLYTKLAAYFREVSTDC